VQVSGTDGALVVNGRKIAVYAVMNAAEIPWRYARNLQWMEVWAMMHALPVRHRADRFATLRCPSRADSAPNRLNQSRIHGAGAAQGGGCRIHLRVDRRVHRQGQGSSAPQGWC